MADTFNKKEREKKREQKRKEKLMRKENRKDNSTDGSLGRMMAYVDEFGNIVDTPPDPTTKKEVKASQIELGVPKRDHEDYDPTLKGYINYFDDTKGYGFIKGEDDESFFVHLNNIKGPQPARGQKVTFEKEKGPKGWVAVNVTIL